MTQNEKELLLRDLCGRIPYNTRLKAFDLPDLDFYLYSISSTDVVAKTAKGGVICMSIEGFKPYLFPMSSMTEEQWIDTPYANLNRDFTFDSFKCGCSTLAFQTYEVDLRYVVDFINWCYKNHFDVNGLIPMGLAIDATNLKIY